MVPRNLQDQYELIGGTVLQSVCKLLNALEHIEKAYPTKKECEGSKASATGEGSSKKLMVTFSGRIPKKPHKDVKHYALCKKHCGMQDTHNMGDCKKYNLDGTPKKGFAGKNAQCNMHHELASCEPNGSHSAVVHKDHKS